MSKKTSFTTKLDLTLKEKLLSDLQDQGFEIFKPPYTFFSAKKSGLVCTFYESGSLVVQGGKIQEFIEFYLEPEILKSFTFTHPEATIDLTSKIGVDEAGKGDFFGPLCIASVYADAKGIKDLLKIGVADSKKIADTKIVKLAVQIKKTVPFSVLALYPETYNDLYQKFKNLNSLLAWGHATVIGNLSLKTGCTKALSDKFASSHVLESALKRKNLKIDLEQKTKAESDPIVAAASILARNCFLEGMEKLEKEFQITLPKGASKEVIKAGRKIILKMGKEILGKISKTHFKTYHEVCSSE